ncbi:MAG: nucleoside transporter [Gammaproteobacteria bacterium]|nr:nucleoside transporter [Gammaproteobacteria bacterium]
MSEVQEFENQPVAANKLEPARHFAASYAGEHVAGTEFVIGALFVSLGVSTYDVIVGLLMGNILAILTWAFITAPIAVRTRLTLYAYLEKVAGPGVVKIYSLINGFLFVIIAGAMITVSASAVRIPFGIPPQVTWYPNSISFVFVAVVVGIVISYVAINGFKKVAQFAAVCAPWMILMFLIGGIAALPILTAATDGVSGISSFADFAAVGDTFIWREQDNGIGIWHVAAFAWVCNVPMHGAMSDMTILRFAKKSSYGFFSALGMFIGHYMAWICAGIMGAAAAMILNTTVSQLDAGEVAYQALGWAGILAVIIAGWTTSNPTIYRAGLAFQSINPKWDRIKVTIVVGVFTTIIACFPFAFAQMLDFLGIMGLAIAPIGAILFAEHWLLNKVGMTPYWNSYKGNNINVPALVAWLGSLVFAFLLNTVADVHLFFLLLPTWIVATVGYMVMAAMAGAKEDFTAQAAQEVAAYEARVAEEKAFFSHSEQIDKATAKDIAKNPLITLAKVVAIGSLVSCCGLAIWVYSAGPGALGQFQQWLVLPTILYFISGTYWFTKKESAETDETEYYSQQPEVESRG